MQRVVYSLYIDIPKEEIDIFDKNLLKKGDTPININTKNKMLSKIFMAYKIYCNRETPLQGSQKTLAM